VNTGGVHVGNLPSNLSVTVLTQEVVSLPRKSLLRKPRKWLFAIANILVIDLFATGYIQGFSKKEYNF